MENSAVLTEKQKSKCQAIIHRAAEAVVTRVSTTNIFPVWCNPASVSPYLSLELIRREMICELGKVFGIEISEKEAREILDSTKKDVAEWIVPLLPFGGFTDRNTIEQEGARTKEIGWEVANDFARKTQVEPDPADN